MSNLSVTTFTTGFVALFKSLEKINHGITMVYKQTKRVVKFIFWRYGGFL